MRPRHLLFVLPVLLAGAGCKDGCGRAPRGVDRSGGAIPSLRAVRVKPGAIRVDGRLDEPAWKTTGSTGPFVHPGSGREQRSSPVNARARLAWDERALYVGCVVRDARPRSPFARDDVDPHVWTRSSAVELMIQPGDPGDNRHYYEVQVDVNGAVWDTRFDDYNRPIRQGPRGRLYGHQQWSARAERAVVIGKGRYTLELALPWSALRARPGSGVAIPPREHDVWRVNLYSFRDGQRASLAWSPILGEGNFHRASRFGRVVFVTRP